MEEDKLKQIEEMPKAVLHLHLDGSLRPETVYKWLKEQEKDVTLDQVKRDLMVNKDCRDLNEYLQKFDLPLQVLQTKEHIEQATYELFEDLAKQNVIYAEVRFAPNLHMEQGLEHEQIVEVAIKGMNKAKEEFGIDGNLILCCMRGNDNTISNLRTVATAKKYLNKGVCGLDLAGAEALYPTSDYKDLFTYAKKIGIPYTIHAGEADGYDSIKAAIEFGAKRLGHGVNIIGHEDLIEKVINSDILLEVCPTSNVQTNIVQSYKDLPIKKLYDKGIAISINTDNRTVSNTNLTKEYQNIVNSLGFKEDDIIKMNKDAIKHSFLLENEKQELLNKYNSLI